MHPRDDRPRPTDGELEILEALWRIGPATVRRVHDEFVARRGNPVGYTTVLKLMQIMTDKGLLRRDTSSRSHVYEPAVSAESTQRGLVRDLIDRAFAGSAAQLVQRAIDERDVTPEEIARIREMLATLEDQR